MPLCDIFCCDKRTAFSTGTCGPFLLLLRSVEVSRIPFWNRDGVIVPNNDAGKHSIQRISDAPSSSSLNFLSGLPRNFRWRENGLPEPVFIDSGKHLRQIFPLYRKDPAQITQLHIPQQPLWTELARGNPQGWRGRTGL